MPNVVGNVKDLGKKVGSGIKESAKGATSGIKKLNPFKKQKYDRGLTMFRNMRRLFQYWKSTLFDNEQIKPTVYKVGNKKYIKVKFQLI